MSSQGFTTFYSFDKCYYGICWWSQESQEFSDQNELVQNMNRQKAEYIEVSWKNNLLQMPRNSNVR